MKQSKEQRGCHHGIAERPCRGCSVLHLLVQYARQSSPCQCDSTDTRKDGGRICSMQAIYERKWKTWQGRRLREINIACLNIALLHQDILGLLAQCSNLYGKYSRVREKSVVNDMWADQPNTLLMDTWKIGQCVTLAGG